MSSTCRSCLSAEKAEEHRLLSEGLLAWLEQDDPMQILALLDCVAALEYIYCSGQHIAHPFCQYCKSLVALAGYKVPVLFLLQTDLLENCLLCNGFKTYVIVEDSDMYILQIWATTLPIAMVCNF